MSENPLDETRPTSRIPASQPMPEPTSQPIPEPMPQPTAAGPTTAGPDDTTERTTERTTDRPDPGSTRTLTVPEQDTVVVAEPRRQARMRTVVIGVVLLVIAVLANLKITTSVDFQLGTVVLALMIGCGVLLIVGASRRE